MMKLVFASYVKYGKLITDTKRLGMLKEFASYVKYGKLITWPWY